MSEDKKQLRRAFKERGRALTADYRQTAARAIFAAVHGSEQWKNAQGVFLFVSMWAEPNTGALFAAAFAEGKRVYVPLCCPDGAMRAVRIRSLDELRPGSYGIPEPPADGETAKPGDLDLALVPCVTATRDGARLGHGAGYYDRFLCAHTCETICLCYARMLADTLPMDESDVRMDAVVTEEGII